MRRTESSTLHIQETDHERGREGGDIYEVRVEVNRNI